MIIFRFKKTLNINLLKIITYKVVSDNIHIFTKNKTRNIFSKYYLYTNLIRLLENNSIIAFYALY